MPRWSTTRCGTSSSADRSVSALSEAVTPSREAESVAVIAPAVPEGVQKAKILVVDDEPKSLYAMQELLGSLDETLLVAPSGEEALKLALKNDFAVILLDVRMPGIDGFETAKLIRSRERSRLTPIIFLTAANDDMSSMFRGYEVGAVDYLLKPVVPEILKSKVSVFVDLFRKGERLRESEDKLRRLAAHLISIREEERAHIAREIHDELGQVLTGIKMEVTWLAKRLTDPVLLEKTDSMCGLIDSTVQTVRKIATGLRPEMLDDMGLVAAVQWQAKEFQKRTGIRCRAKLPPETAKPDHDVATTVFRIFQEILTNVARHSRATRVDIDLSLGEDKLELDVLDNGVGIQDCDVGGRKSLGLLGMQERALLFGGEVKVSGKAGEGTRVAVTIPIARNAAA
jgi:signal transduction histidine kinase